MKHIQSIIRIFTISLILLTVSCSDTLMGDKGKYDEEVYLNYKTKTVLELPFENEWYINAGGKSLEENHHFTPQRHQRYALDIVKVINGRSYTGVGTRNEDYYCFGQRLNAPGDGVIVAVENNIHDNVPTVLNTDKMLGNYIIIDHQNGEYSFMLHFKKNSIIVAVGDTVVRGQEVGQAGNSGNSTGPHLHYHLQTSPNLFAGAGLPMQFLNYSANNVFVQRGEPITGQSVKKN